MVQGFHLLTGGGDSFIHLPNQSACALHPLLKFVRQIGNFGSGAAQGI